MKRPPTDRLVNKIGVPVTIWNDIENSYKTGKEIYYNGYRYRVVAIYRLLHTEGDTALAELKVVRNFLG